MANSEGRAGGMNFHPRQLQKEWKSYEDSLKPVKQDIETFLKEGVPCQEDTKR